MTMAEHAPESDGGPLTYDVFETPLGLVGVLATSRGVRRTTLPEPTTEAAMSALGTGLGVADHDPQAVEAYARPIRAYLAGEPVDLAVVPLDRARATEFFGRAWAACRAIPAGQTRTYAWLAQAAGRPRAVRAAGQAMARNPLPLLVPCHRVVGSDGGLHGFGGSIGLPLKSRLLELERRAAAAAA